MKTFVEVSNLGKKYNNILSLPAFETTPAELQESCRVIMTHGDGVLDTIGKLKPDECTFDNTIVELDRAYHKISSVLNRFSLIKETNQSSEMREAAKEATKKLEDWIVAREYREDVYHVIQTFSQKWTEQKQQDLEDVRLMERMLQDFTRAGLHLSKDKRDLVEQYRKELSALTTDFQSNIAKAKCPLVFTKEELQGVPDSLLSAKDVKTGDNEYTICPNVTFHYLAIMDNADNPEVRRKVLETQHSLAKEVNVPLVKQILVTRHKIASLLGFKCWADYMINIRMAKTGSAALEFEEKLKTGLQPKLEAELAEFQKLKDNDPILAGKPKERVTLSDWRYYSNKLKKEQYTVDSEQLRVFFPMDRVLHGMFAIYQRIFGLRFEQIEAPYKWVDDLQLWAVFDSETEEPLGFFYLDMYPREGKYNHYAVFGIIDSMLTSDRSEDMKNFMYQRPVCSLVCNFSPPTSDKPSLLDHREVVTCFHEFGHAMHHILSTSRYATFAGTNVPRDFVEAPSQMLESWAWDKEVLDTFAADYRDYSKKIPGEILDKLLEAKYAIEG